MTLDDELRDALRSLNDAKYEYNEAWRIYEEWYDRIRAVAPAPDDETQSTNPDLERAYYKLLRAQDEMEQAQARVFRIQARMSAEVRRRAASLHTMGPKPWTRRPATSTPRILQPQAQAPMSTPPAAAAPDAYPAARGGFTFPFSSLTTAPQAMPAFPGLSGPLRLEPGLGRRVFG